MQAVDDLIFAPLPLFGPEDVESPLCAKLVASMMCGPQWLSGTGKH